MIPTPEQAWELLCEYNEGEFHRKHARTVGDVLRWFAQEEGFGDVAGCEALYKTEEIVVIKHVEVLSHSLISHFAAC